MVATNVFISLLTLQFTYAIGKRPDVFQQANTAVVHGETSVRYESFHGPVAFSEAESFCKSKGGNLAKFTTDETTYLAENQISKLIFDLWTGCAWIGMSDILEEGDWRWFDGTPVTDTSVKWAYHNPLIFYIEQSWWDCGKVCVVNAFGIVHWDMAACQMKLDLVCQYESENTTQPVTTIWKGNGAFKQETIKPKPTVSKKEKKVPLKHAFAAIKVIADLYNPKLRAQPDEIESSSDVEECLRLCTDVETCSLINFSPPDQCAMYWNSTRAQSLGAESVRRCSVWIHQERVASIRT